MKKRHYYRQMNIKSHIVDLRERLREHRVSRIAKLSGLSRPTVDAFMNDAYPARIETITALESFITAEDAASTARQAAEKNYKS